MKALLILFALALAGPAAAGEYSLEKRPEVVFKGGHVHRTPYPQTQRSTSVWVSDACWRDCSASCTWKMEACVRGGGDADACRPYLDACDRSCQRSCRSPWSGPLLDFLDF
jgi:hypothetical protein